MDFRLVTLICFMNSSFYPQADKNNTKWDFPEKIIKN